MLDASKRLDEIKRLAQALGMFHQAMLERLLDKVQLGWHGWDDPAMRQELMHRWEGNYHKVRQAYLDGSDPCQHLVDMAVLGMMLWRMRKVHG